MDKRHAVIMYDYCDKKFKVKDLNSANGVSCDLFIKIYFCVRSKSVTFLCNFWIYFARSLTDSCILLSLRLECVTKGNDGTELFWLRT